jgi:16S rRNA (adenine1518-N6/adenine1519-N6)-dimethyltransferase
MDRKELNYLLKKYHLHPKRENSQNFLINPQTVKKLIESAEISKNDVVLEIGAGLGALTSELCLKAKRVIAVEIDKNFLPVLENLSKANKNLEIINQDIFKTKIKNEKYKIVSSLPYNITSLFFRHFLENEFRPELIAVIIQKEVAERIVARPGQMSLLALSVQLFGEPKIAKIVPKSDFWPKPEVESAILTVKNIKKPENIEDLRLFFRLLHIGFSAKRKKLSNNLQNGLKIEKKAIEEIIKKAKLNENCRAQELSLEQWLWIFDCTKKFML